jgi:hypothetical protein
VWSTRHELIGQVRDTGHITGPHPGQVRPGTVSHGLWVFVRQICDRVQIRTGPTGTVIQICMRLNPSPAG